MTMTMLRKQKADGFIKEKNKAVIRTVEGSQRGTKRRKMQHPFDKWKIVDSDGSDDTDCSYDINDIKLERGSKSRKLSVDVENWSTDDGHLTFTGSRLDSLDLVESHVSTVNPFMPPVLNFHKEPKDHLYVKMPYISQNLAIELGLTEAKVQHASVQKTMIFLSDETVPLLLLVVGSPDKDDLPYARSLARELTHKMRDFTDESFNILCEVIDEAKSTNINWTQISTRLLQENQHLYPYERLTMNQKKFQNLQKSLQFVMSATSIPSCIRNDMPAQSNLDDTDNVPIYQLTKEQLDFMQKLLKKDKPCFITGKPASGKTVMGVEIARRLNQDGETQLICHDPILKDKLTSMSGVKVVRTSPGDLSLAGWKHIVAVKVPEKELQKYKDVPRVPGAKLFVFYN